MKQIRMILALGLLAGCAEVPRVDKETTAQIQSGSRISRDEVRKTTFVDAQKINFNNPHFWDPDARDQGSYWLRAAKEDSKAEAELFLSFNSTRAPLWGWAYWERAFDESGLQFPVTKLRSDSTGDGTTSEWVAIHMTRQFLDEHRAKGIRLRIDGQHAQKQIFLPPNYVDAFLAKLDESLPK